MKNICGGTSQTAAFAAEPPRFRAVCGVRTNVRTASASDSTFPVMEKRSAALLGTCMDLLLDAVCLVDSGGRFVWVSAASEQIFGYTPDEMIGRAMIDMVVPDDRARTLEAAWAIMSGDPRLHFETATCARMGASFTSCGRRAGRTPTRCGSRSRATSPGAHRRRRCRQLCSPSRMAAHTAEDLPALFHRVHQIIDKLLPADNFFVAMIDDEGGLSFPYCVDKQDHDDAAARNDPVVQALCAEIVHSGLPLVLPSIGIALYPDNGDNADQLFRVAGQAMYAAKNARDRPIETD